MSATQACLNIEENAWKDSLGATECSLMPTIEECPLRGASFEATTMHDVHILPFLGSLRPFFYLQSTLSIPEPLSSDVVDHAGQPPAGGTSKLENTKNNETFKQPQDERDTLQQTTPQQLASNIDGHKPPVDTATTTNTQPYSDAKVLDINIKKNGAASSPVPSEQDLCILQSE